MSAGVRVRLAIVFVVIAALVAAGVVVTVVSRSAPTPAGGPVAIPGGSDRCGGWATPRPGPVTFRVTNTANNAMEVYLEDPSTGRVYGGLEGVGPTATSDLRVVLGDGRYRFVCLVEEQPVFTGSVFTVWGAPKGLAVTPGVRPVTDNDLARPVADYAGWVESQFPVVTRAIETLGGAVARGDVAASRTAWLDAHLAYTRLGGAYGDFGDDGDVVDDGFARLETDLWSRDAVGAAASAHAAALAAAVSALQTAFVPSRFVPLDMGLRAHEITEDAILEQLDGRADALSGTGLATIDAGFDATREVLGPMSSLLRSRGYDVAGAEAALTRAQTLVETHHVGGVWTPVAQLTRPDREALDAAMNSLAETLAPIAAITDVRQAVSS